jgi:hypothetical protein
MPITSSKRLTIQAQIDGRDQLIIKESSMQWHHFDWAAVGRHLGANSPTIVHSEPNGFGAEWFPDWPMPVPDEIRFEAFSSVFYGIDSPSIGGGLIWSLDKLFGRGNVQIV